MICETELMWFADRPEIGRMFLATSGQVACAALSLKCKQIDPYANYRSALEPIADNNFIK